MNVNGMRKNTFMRRAKLNQSGNLGHIVVYLFAIVLGVTAAYVFLSTGPLKGSSSVDVGDNLETGAATRAHRRSFHERQQQDGERRSSGQEKVVTAESAEEDAWFKKLDAAGCKATEELRVCSHRAKSMEITDVFPGSISAYQALWKAKVKCFDIDFVATSDGQLLASHPDDLQQALPEVKVGRLNGTIDSSLGAVRKAGADDERYPTMEAVLQVLAKMLESEEDKFWLKDGPGHLDYSRLPGIFMDLKGAAFTPEALNKVTVTAQELHITPHVAVFVMDAQQEATARKAGYTGPLIRGYLDQPDPNPPLTAEALAPYIMLGPSIRMADAFFRSAAQLEKPVHAWTVDTPGELHRALELGLDSVISNRPLALRQTLFDWRDKCSDQL